MFDNASLLLLKEASQLEVLYFYYGQENLAVLIEVHSHPDIACISNTWAFSGFPVKFWVKLN